MSINELVEQALTDVGLPFAFLRYVGAEKRYITYSSSLVNNLFADDSDEGGYYSVTITVFSDSNYLATINNIIAKMKLRGFIFDEEGIDMEDEETGLFYKTIYFKIERSL